MYAQAHMHVTKARILGVPTNFGCVPLSNLIQSSVSIMMTNLARFSLFSELQNLLGHPLLCTCELYVKMMTVIYHGSNQFWDVSKE